MIACVYLQMNQLVHFMPATAPAKPSPVEPQNAPFHKGRTNDPARTQAEILTVATAEFARKGLSGARIDAIAAATRTSKRMI